MPPICMVCFNDSRRPRFVTKSSVICQWCVSELKSIQYSPAHIYSQARKYIASRVIESGQLSNDLGKLESIVKKEFNRFLVSRLSPVPAKLQTTRVIRAYRLGIIQFRPEFAQRLDGESAQSLGADIRARDGNVCVICRRLPRGSELHVHHVIPLASYGTNHRTNLATLCISCHRRQHPNFLVGRIRDIADEFSLDA